MSTCLDNYRMAASDSNRSLSSLSLLLRQENSPEPSELSDSQSASFISVQPSCRCGAGVADGVRRVGWDEDFFADRRAEGIGRVHPEVAAKAPRSPILGDLRPIELSRATAHILYFPLNF